MKKTLWSFLILFPLIGCSSVQAQDWFSQDIGAVGTPGNTQYEASTDVFTVSGAGADIGGTADAFQFTSQTLAADGAIIARINTMDNIDPGSKAGVMIRSDLGAGAIHTTLFVTSSGSVGWINRVAANATSTETMASGSSPLPVFLKITRKGGNLRGYTSPDGLNWTAVGTSSMATGPVYVGLAVTSRNTGQLCSARFDNVGLRIGSEFDATPPTVPTNLKVDSCSDVSVSLSWNPSTDNMGVVGYDVSRNGTKIASTSVPRFIDTTVVSGGTYTYTVQAYDDSGNVSFMSAPTTVTTDTVSLQAPWGHVDVGTVGASGSAAVSNGVFYLRGAGGVSPISYDSGHYAYRTLSGNAQIIGRIAGFNSLNTNGWAAIGIRQNLTSFSPQAMMSLKGDGQTAFGRRLGNPLDNHPQSTAAGPVGSECWFKVIRLGETLLGYKSANGIDWTLAGVEIIQMPSTITVGMMVNSYDNLNLATGRFDHIDITQPLDSIYSLPFDPLQIPSVTTIQTLAGASASVTQGGWVQDGTSLFCNTRRGSVDYNLSIPADGAYRLEIIGDAIGTSLDTTFPLDVSIDGEFIDRVNLMSPLGNTGSANVFTPWLRAGNHTVHIFWDNALLGRFFRLSELRLQTLSGIDQNGNGIPDWVENRLRTLNGLDHKITSSITSPACIEGKTRYRSMMAIAGGVPILAGAGARWFANVPLNANGDTTIQISYENGALMEVPSIHWDVTNLLTAQNLVIRQGDSLLLTAEPAGVTDGNVQITIGSSVFQTTAGHPLAQAFNTAGTYQVTGKYNNGTPRTISVKVVAADFGSSPEAWMGKARNWDCPNIPTEAVVEADSRINFSFVQNLNPKGRRFSIMVDAAEPRGVVARLGANGPILASATIQGISVYSSIQTNVNFIQTFADGSRLVEMPVIISGPLNGLTIKITISCAGVTFEDGTLVKILTAADFDSLGQAKVRFIYGVDVQSSVCHFLAAYQGGLAIGNR